MISPAIAAIAIGVLAAVAFGGGFLISDWRSQAEIERLRGANTMLAAVNTQCAADVVQVESAVKELEAVVIERERRAAEAMTEAQPAAEKHKAKVIKIRALPVVKPDEQCAAMVREQIEYVQGRRGD